MAYPIDGNTAFKKNQGKRNHCLGACIFIYFFGMRRYFSVHILEVNAKTKITNKIDVGHSNQV